MRSPFKFLDSYTKEDRNIFFGRDREIEELYQRVFDSKLLLVYGISGTGKSSLIHCGLANKFLETDWLPLVIRRGGNIVESLASAVSSASLTKQQSKFASHGVFKKGVRSLYLDHYKPVFFIFDQFEELFIFGDKEERRTFISIVKSLTESELQCRMIFVMREEYMAGITEFEKYIPTIFSNRVRIEKMSHRNALAAIKEPCRVFNITLEEGFAESLLEKLSPGETDVELTYLQVFLDKIFRLSTGSLPPPGGESKGGSSEAGVSPTFTLSLLEKTGNVSDLLGSFLDDQIAIMEDPDTAMRVLKAFVSGKGTKRPASEQEAIDNIRSFGKEISPEKVKELIQSFVKLRVLRDKDENDRYELRHDALAEKVYEKFSTSEKELLEIKQFIENSYQSYLKRRILLSNEDLEYISNKDTQLSLNVELKGFIDACRRHQKAKLKTLRRLIFVSAVSFIILICIPLYYVLETVKQTIADRRAIRSMSQYTDPAERLRVAGAAWRQSPGALEKEALLKAFNDIFKAEKKDSVMTHLAEKYNIEFDPAPVYIQYARCSNDNRYIFGYGDSLIMLWTMNGKLDNVINTSHYPVIDIKMSEDSKLLGAIGTDSVLTVWDISGKALFNCKSKYNRLNTEQIFKFTKENNIIIIGDKHDALLFDRHGKILQYFNKHIDGVNAIDLSPDNKFLATASNDSTINIWYYNSVKNRYDFYNTLTWHEDTVLSVSFGKNNVFLASTSKGKFVIIGDINNRIIYSGIYNRNYCYARFTPSGNGLIIGSYYFKNNQITKLFFCLNFTHPVYELTGRIYNGDLYDESAGFNSLEFSIDENYFISSDSLHIYLTDNNLALERNRFSIVNAGVTYTLLTFSGSNPFFTDNQDYLMFVDKNIIHACYIKLKTITDIADNL